MFKQLISRLPFLLLIILLASFLRVYMLNTDPPSLFGDEVDVGYQAYSLGQTGRDLSGQFLPMYLRSLSEYRAPLYIYSAVPFVKIFGLNEWGVRLPAAFWGVLGVIGLYLVVKELLDRKIALVSAFLMSIAPWSLQYSRASFEVTMLLAFLLFGAFFFIKGLQNKKFLIPSIILFCLTPYIYSTASVFTPLFILLLCVLNYRKIVTFGKFLLIPIAVGIIIALPIAFSVVQGQARERFGLVSIFQDSVLLDKVNLARKAQSYYNADGYLQTVNSPIEVLFHNRPGIYLQVFSMNYLKAFSFDFLFAEGDPDFRQSIHEMGELYIFELFLILIGVYILLRHGNKRTKLLILGWLLLTPIPAALTSDGGYHATRLILMLPPLMILDALGLCFLFSKYRQRYYSVALAALGVVFIASLLTYFDRYYVHYPVESWRWWHEGFKEAMTYMKDNESGYNQLVFNNTYEPSLIRFLFWWQYPPSNFQPQYSDLEPKKDILPDFNGFSIDNRYFFGEVENGGVIQFIKPGMMYMVSQQDEVPGNWNWAKNPPSDIRVLKTVYDPTGVPIFYVITAKS